MQLGQDPLHMDIIADATECPLSIHTMDISNAERVHIRGGLVMCSMQLDQDLLHTDIIADATECPLSIHTMDISNAEGVHNLCRMVHKR